MRALFVAASLLLSSGLAVAQHADDQTLSTAHAQKAAVLAAAGDWSAATVEYQIAYRILPLPELLFDTARTYEKAGQLDDAKEFYLKYLKLEPDGVSASEATLRLGRLLGASSDAAGERLVARTMRRDLEPRQPMRLTTDKPKSSRLWILGPVAGGALLTALGISLSVALAQPDPRANFAPGYTFQVLRIR